MSTSNRMPVIQVIDDRKPMLAGGPDAAEGMLFFLHDIGSPNMSARIGQEVRVARRPITGSTQFIDVTRGETYANRAGRKVTGGRYLMRDHRVGGRIIGALNYTLMDRGSKLPLVVLSNLVVDQGWRRQGVASRLLEELLEDHPQARVDDSMTPDGAAFFGYEGRTYTSLASNDSLAAARRFRA